jgi:hypothetical protein
MARSLRSAAICSKRAGADLSLSSRVCAMLMSLSRVRNAFRFMAFLHAARLAPASREKNANDWHTVPPCIWGHRRPPLRIPSKQLAISSRGAF